MLACVTEDPLSPWNTVYSDTIYDGIVAINGFQGDFKDIDYAVDCDAGERVNAPIASTSAFTCEACQAVNGGAKKIWAAVDDVDPGSNKYVFFRMSPYPFCTSS